MNNLFFIAWILLLQVGSGVSVMLQVRYLDGRPFEQTIQLRNDEGEPLQTCQPDADGRCTLQLTRGLYLVEPMGTQLDDLSAAAAVEIGGRWLAITVGDAPLDYGFVIDEWAVYFDDAPNAARPQPIRPTQADLAAHFAEAIEPELAATPDSADTSPTPQSTILTTQAAETAHNRLLRWLLFMLTFTTGGVAIWWLLHRKPQ